MMSNHLTQKDIRRYIRLQHISCPFCEDGGDVAGVDSSNIEIGEPVTYECYQCGGKWESTYKLIGLRVLLEPVKEVVS